eukprot:6939775-Prymnesium_polylepis.1
MARSAATLVRKRRLITTMLPLAAWVRGCVVGDRRDRSRRLLLTGHVTGLCQTARIWRRWRQRKELYRSVVPP